MVLGIKNKYRRGPSIQVEYIIHVQDIKPWPPTQSLKTVRSVLIQWENGERNSGATSAVTPSLDNGKIEFNESFRLPVTLSRDLSVKNGDTDVFQKNLLEFNLYEPRRDKTVKGQLLGTAIVDLADYGVVKEVTSVGAPMNCTRSFRNSAQPILHLRIQAYDRARSSSSLRGRLAKEGSLDKTDEDSVSALMSEEYADEAEIASLTDDDTSSHSSVATASIGAESAGISPSHTKENGSARNMYENNMPTSLSGTSESISKLKFENQCASRAESVTLCQGHQSSAQIEEEIDLKLHSEKDSSLAVKVIPMHSPETLNSQFNGEQHTNGEIGKTMESLQRKSYKEAAEADKDEVEVKEENHRDNSGYVGQILDKERNVVYSSSSSPLDAFRKQVLSESGSSLNRERTRPVKSVRSSMDSSRTNVSASAFFASAVKLEAKVFPAEKQMGPSDSTTQKLEQRIKLLETELREAAAMEVALYSIVAEHGSSTNKVHSPARRLSRLYLQAGNEMKRASAAKSTVSGLVVVAKACGNDVPRLTFWLSNCVVLRAIISEEFGEEQLPVSAGPFSERNGESNGINKTTLKWKFSSEEQVHKRTITESSWAKNPDFFLSAIEKIESWIFSRIVESVWWQTLTPYMQSSATKVISKVVDSSCRSNYRRASASGDQDQVDFSIELWKRAFNDACERLCPVRSGGHDCGCLPVLSKLVMEQCVSRLDVAMFNAILRESVDDIPTDPVSDPISDAKVLPILAGKSSFGAGAQLKNTIGNWSRWLADLFGIDDDDDEDAPEDGIDDSGVKCRHDSSFKSFHLLKSLSDLMMLPKDMLLSESVRREVCPKFGASLIKRVLENFVPDEFCPDLIPDAVFKALDSEVLHADGDGPLANFPCTAPAVFYSPPSSSSLISVMGGSVGTGSHSLLRRSTSVLRRSNTSDDELDELDAPLNSILGDKLSDSLQVSPAQMKPNWKEVQNHQKNVVRYQLLREMWSEGI